MEDSQNREIIRELPVNLWVIGLFFSAGGIFYYFKVHQWVFLAVGVGVGLAVLFLSTIVRVGLKDNGLTLYIQRQGLFRHSEQELDVEDIQSIAVQQSSNSGGSSSPTYRVAIAMKDGQVYPLHGYYSSGFTSKDRTARQLREAIGLKAQDQFSGGLGSVVSQIAKQVYEPGGKAIEEMEAQEAGGVIYRLQTVSFGSSSITRWLSADFTTRGNFLFLVQKFEGQEGGGMVMSLMGKTLMRQSLKMYGFEDEHLPDLENAMVLNKLEQKVEKYFFGFGTDQPWANQLLNVWVTAPLVGWVADHPMKHGGKQSAEYNQLAVLFSPKGVYINCLGELDDFETGRLVDLGVEVVKSLER